MRVQLPPYKEFSPNPYREVVLTVSPPFWTASRANKTGPKTWLRDRRREDVRALREFAMVPLAIADALGMSDTTVAGYLRELEAAGEIEPLPPWLSLHCERSPCS